jgi:xylan 1,4-beta-xylosidase
MAEVHFYSDLNEENGVLHHSWEHTVGSCHALLALRSDWQAQLKQCHQELGFRFVRFHGLLCDDVGVLTIQNKKPVYSFFNPDSVIDFLLSIGMKPFLELSFMPEALASGRKTVFHYRGNVTPPKDYKSWSLLIYKMVDHWKRRYGPEEVRQWYFEVWNEPNLKAFWTGSMKEYFKLYEFTASAIKDVDSEFRVGGPATAKNEWIEEFMEFCERKKIPADFLSTHHYPTDAFGKPGDNTIEQLASSRRSVLCEQVQDVRRKAGAKPLFYTEWNTSSNPRDNLHDQPYAAAFIGKTVLEVDPFVNGYSYWTFSDIFEENYFPSVPFHGGFGLLNLHGIRKPAYRAFELLHRLGKKRLFVDGIHETVDCTIVKSAQVIHIVLTNHSYPIRPIEDEKITVHLRNCPEPNAVYSEKINEKIANPCKQWIAMGSPEYLSAEQLEQLQKASEIVRTALPWRKNSDEILIRITLQPHTFALITTEIHD